MRALLDTHAFLLWISESPKLSGGAREFMADENNELLFSVVSGWEIAIKVGVGKLGLPDVPAKFLAGQISVNGMEVLPIYFDHALRVAVLPDHHQDPFDRLLVAQALVEELPVVSGDGAISRYPVETIW